MVDVLIASSIVFGGAIVLSLDEPLINRRILSSGRKRASNLL